MGLSPQPKPTWDFNCFLKSPPLHDFTTSRETVLFLKEMITSQMKIIKKKKKKKDCGDQFWLFAKSTYLLLVKKGVIYPKSMVVIK